MGTTETVVGIIPTMFALSIVNKIVGKKSKKGKLKL